MSSSSCQASKLVFHVSSSSTSYNLQASSFQQLLHHNRFVSVSLCFQKLVYHGWQPWCFYERNQEDAKGIDWNVTNYGVSFGEDGVEGGNGGLGNGGLGSKANNNEIIIDKKLGEDNKDIFQVELDAQQKQMLVQLEFNQKYWLMWQRSTSTWAFF